MKKIIYYKHNGTSQKEEELTLENLKHTSGMMSKCSMEDGSVYTGYADPLRTNSKSSLVSLNLFYFTNYSLIIHQAILMCQYNF